MKEKMKMGSRLLGLTALAMMMALLFGFALIPAHANAEEVPFITLEGSQTGNKITLKWGGRPDVSKYEIWGGYVGKNMARLKTVTNNTVTSATLKKLNKKKIDPKKVFKFKILAYKAVNGQDTLFVKSPAIYIAGSKHPKYTNPKTLTVEKISYALQPGQTDKITAKLTLPKKNKKKKHLPEACGPKYSYYSTDKSVATVNTYNGTITALSPGTCSIYVYTVNGKTQRITVAVQ